MARFSSQSIIITFITVLLNSEQKFRNLSAMMRAGPGVAFAILLALTVISDQGRDGIKLAGAVNEAKFVAKLQREFAFYQRGRCRSEPDLGSSSYVSHARCYRWCYENKQCGWVQYDFNAEYVNGKRCAMFTECKEYPEDEADPITIPDGYPFSFFPILARKNFPKKKRLAFFIAPNGVQRMASECKPANCKKPLKVFKNVKNWKKCMKKCKRIERCKHFEFFKLSKACKLFKGVPALAFTGKKVKSGTRPGNDPREDTTLPISWY